MATVEPAHPALADLKIEPGSVVDDPLRWLDRSSLPAEFLVAIEGMTAAQWWNLAPDCRFCEYLDGVVYMPSPVTDRHQEHTGFVYFLLAGFRDERGLGQVLTGPAVMPLGERRFPEPDLFVRPVADRAEPGGPRAIFVLEVLSPSNRAHDLERKAAIYREEKIPEIWYLDNRDKCLWIDRQDGTGYRRDRYASGFVTCSTIPGFWIDVDWLWADPLPSALRCLARILAGPPG